MHSPSFSKEAVRHSEHLITDMLAKFLEILSGYVPGARPVDFTRALSCLFADIAMNYAFQRPFNALDEEGFQSDLLKGVETFAVMGQWPVHFPRVFGGVTWGIQCLPRWLTSRIIKPFALVDWCLDVSTTRTICTESLNSSAYVV